MALVQTTDPATVRATLKERPDAIRPDLARQAARRAHDRRGFYADDVLGAKVSLSGSLGAEDGQVLLLGLDLACDADRTAGDRRTLPQRRADVLVQWAREAAARLSGPGDTLARDAHTVRTHLLITCTPDQLTGRISTGSSSTALGSTGSGAGRSSCAGARTGNGTTGSGTTGSDTGSGTGSGSASASGSGESAGASGPSSTAPHPRRPQDLPGLPGDGLPRPAGFPTPGTLLTPDALRRLACDTTLTLVTTDPDGTPLAVGRSARTVTGAQWRALVVRDRTCVVRGCSRRPAQCQAHHVQHWTDGGPTDLDNLVHR